MVTSRLRGRYVSGDGDAKWHKDDGAMTSGEHAHDPQLSAFCPKYHHAIEVIGRRWTGAVLRAMLSGAARFSDIGAAVPGLSDRLLSERLKELEAEGILTRIVVPSTPVRVDYRLTAKGEALHDVIAAVAAWADQWEAISEPIEIAPPE
jgi:DNA-binding HxlR family transcriptional regulator